MSSIDLYFFRTKREKYASRKAAVVRILAGASLHPKRVPIGNSKGIPIKKEKNRLNTCFLSTEKEGFEPSRQFPDLHP